MARWAWRLFRREWRQQVLVLALLIFTVAAAAFSVSAAYNVASLPGPQFGSANHLLQFDGTSPKDLAADIAAARKAFGTIQVIGRRLVPIPGSAQTVEFRAEDPHGPYSGPMLALTQGRYPAGAGQVAVTGQLAQALQLRIGSPLSLGGQHQTVTGIVENPSDLSDQFALVSPAGAGPPQSVTVLLNASPASFAAFLAAFRGPLEWQARGASTQGAVAGGVLGAVTALLLLVSLVAAAGFAVIAARRQRQLGNRGDAQAAADGHGHGRSRGGRHRRRGRDRARPGGVDRRRPRPGHVRRTPDRPARDPVGPGRAGHAARRRDGDRRGVVAGAGRRPATGDARPVGPPAAAQARTPAWPRWPP